METRDHQNNDKSIRTVNYVIDPTKIFSAYRLIHYYDYLFNNANIVILKYGSLSN